MSRSRPGELVVQCSLRDGTGAVLERMLVRVPADAPVAAVLEPVLRLGLTERRRGRGLVVDAPAEVVALLALCGLSGATTEVRP